MFENARFLRTCIQSLQKIALLLKFFFVKKINMGIKIAEFCDDFYFVDAGLTTCSYKRCTGRFFGTGNNFFSEHFFKTPVNKL